MPACQYHINFRQVDGAVTLEVSGELDLADAVRFQDDVRRYGDVTSGRIDLDLTDVSFLDSSGMQALVNARRSLVDEGREFRVVALSPAAQRVLHLTGLDEVLCV
ncbi:MAG TPA: STAS domain-containing protein [Acidimicrobiia bacterium]|jgi:anti-anti-sigma factor